MRTLHPPQVWKFRFDLGEVLRLVEVTERDLHAAKLTLKNRRTRGVGARVVLAGGPSLLHAGWMMKGLRLTVAIPRPFVRVHAIFPTSLHRIASDAGVRHLVHVRNAIVHDEDLQQSTIKTSGSTQRTICSQKRKTWAGIKPRNEENNSWSERTWWSWPYLGANALSNKSTDHKQHLATAPPATTRPNWEAEIYDDIGL